MTLKLIEANLGKIVFARLFEDEELLETINLSAKQSGVNAGVFSLIGTLKKAKVGFYREGKHHTINVEGPLEIVSCTGNISLKENKPSPTLISASPTKKAKSKAVTPCLAVWSGFLENLS
jgi:predicted DNA-binding protein with PD1-like motif